MEYNYLGKSGLRVSNICLGTMTLGHRPDGPVMCTESEAHALLDRFVEAGGNFIDTANVYQKGESEEILGSWLKKQQRDRLVIATKVRGGWDTMNQNGKGLSRFGILHEVEESLRRLQTDYIDLYQIHLWDSAVPIEETLSTLNNLVDQGKVRYIGASNLTGWQLQKCMDLCKYNNWAPFITLQQQWNLLARETEYELIDVCRNEGVGILPWSPLKGGWLSGKVKRGADLQQGSRIAWTSAQDGRRNQSHPDYKQFGDSERVWDLLALMENIAKRHEASVAQVALRWLIQKDTVPSVVIGVKTLEQLKDNLGAASGWALTQQEMADLDEASGLYVPYPYEMNIRLNKDRVRDNPCK